MDLAVVIVIMDMVYQKVAIWLTNREGHKTDLMYEDSLIGKLFVFQFINNCKRDYQGINVQRQQMLSLRPLFSTTLSEYNGNNIPRRSPDFVFSITRR